MRFWDTYCWDSEEYDYAARNWRIVPEPKLSSLYFWLRTRKNPWFQVMDGRLSHEVGWNIGLAELYNSGLIGPRLDV